MHKSTPQLAIKTLFTPTTLVCFLALSLCTPTSTTALPIQRQSSSSPQSASAESIDSPFRTVARPITIQVELLHNEARLIEQTERLEQHYRQQQPHHPSTIDDQIRLALLVQEQDQLEREQQDRDQLLDNEEEAQEAQDPETRRREQEALGLWMSDSEIEALNQGTDEEGACNGSECAREFDLFAEEFQEERNEGVVAEAKEGVHSSTLAPRSLAPEEYKNNKVALPSEEEMLQWPIVNPALFLDREDETQDYYDEQA
ncbi:hypothetical protein BGZ81_009080 [Podila clonocystis]|nr:hypothetical protein BGZ81_009080 [Podila clonocystis]